MRYFLILFFISLGVVYGEPCEKISNFNFGCLFDNKQNIPARSDHLSLGKQRFSITNDISFFDVAEVETDEKKHIIGLTFVKKYKMNNKNIKNIRDVIKEDFLTLLRSLENRWGNFDKKEAIKFLGAEGNSNEFYLQNVAVSVENAQPKSETPMYIGIALQSTHDPEAFSRGEPKTLSLGLMYVSLQAISDIKTQQQTEKEKVFDGF